MSLSVPSAPVPRRVVPLLADLGTAGGHRLVLLSLEVWDGWTDLRFARIDVGADRPLPRRVPPEDAWSVRDDRGRVHRVDDVVGRGDRSLSNGEVRLRPPVSDDATALEVRVALAPGHPELTATVPLPSADPPRGGSAQP